MANIISAARTAAKRTILDKTKRILRIMTYCFRPSLVLEDMLENRAALNQDAVPREEARRCQEGDELDDIIKEEWGVRAEVVSVATTPRSWSEDQDDDMYMWETEDDLEDDLEEEDFVEDCKEDSCGEDE